MKKICYAFFQVLFFSTTAIAANIDSDKQIREFRNLLSQVNDNSPLESAGSHGTMGYSLGVGMSQIKTPETENFYVNEFFNEDTKTNSSLTVPKIWITKGLFWPLDAGAYFGSIKQQANVYTYGAYLQWTIYEDFAVPAIAARYAYSKISGLNQTNFDSHKASLVGSWGFKFITLFFDLSYAQNQMELIVQDEEQIELLESVSIPKGLQKDIETSHQVGLQLAPFSPLTKFTVAVNEPNTEAQFFTAKVSIGL